MTQTSTPKSTSTAAGVSPTSERNTGLIQGLMAYGLWGLLPLYFLTIGIASPMEIVANRIVWSLVFCAILLSVTRNWHQLFALGRDRRAMVRLSVASVLIAVNWLTYTFAVLNGLVGVYYMRGDFEQSRSTAEDLLARALNRNDKTGLLMGHRVLGMSLFAIGELAEARRHLEAALALYEAPLHAPLALVFSHDFKATAEVYLGLTMVLQGDVEAGLAHGRAALAYAEELRQPHSICYVLPFLAGALLVSGMPAAAEPIAERTIVLSAEYGFPQWVAGGLLLRGWARLELGQVESAIADIRSSISGLEASGTLVWMQFARFLLARGLAKAGQSDAALELVERILAEIRATGGRWYEAELHRLKGELLLAAGRPRAEVEACYEAAAAVAARQGSRLWQRRAAGNLATPQRLDAQPPAADDRPAQRELPNLPSSC